MKKSPKNHYEVLGVSSEASEEEIKQAFHDFAKNNHPDLKPEDKDAERLFKEASAAYETLKDPLRRQAFDAALAFDRTHRKAGRRQGRRLLMLFALLLIAPSAIVYSVLMTKDDRIPAAEEQIAAVQPLPGDAALAQDPEDAAQRNVAAVISDATTEAGTGRTGPLTRSAAAEQRETVDISEPAQQYQSPRGDRLSAPASSPPNALPAPAPHTPMPDVRVASLPPERPDIVLTPNVDVSGPFSDCSICPLMFVPKRSFAGLQSADLAISMSEITLAQWEACTLDGGCPEIERPTGRKSQPVIGLGSDGAGAYAAWLSKVTGQTYDAVMPETSGGCGGAPGRVTSNRWDWFQDSADGDCEASSDAKAGSGFRVTRRVTPAS